MFIAPTTQSQPRLAAAQRHQFASCQVQVESINGIKLPIRQALGSGEILGIATNPAPLTNAAALTNLGIMADGNPVPDLP